MTFHSHAMTRDGQWMSFDLYWYGNRKPTHTDAVKYLHELFGSHRCDLTKAKIKHDEHENIVHLYSVRIDGFGGFEK